MATRSFVLRDFMLTPYRFAIVNLWDNELVAESRTPLIAAVNLELYEPYYNRDNDCLVIIDKFKPSYSWLTTDEFCMAFDVPFLRAVRLAQQKVMNGNFAAPTR